MSHKMAKRSMNENFSANFCKQVKSEREYRVLCDAVVQQPAAVNVIQRIANILQHKQAVELCWTAEHLNWFEKLNERQLYSPLRCSSTNARLAFPETLAQRQPTGL